LETSVPRVKNVHLDEASRPLWLGVLTGALFFGTFLGLEGCLFRSLQAGHVWLAAVMIFAIAHLMHAHLIAFHEAAHRSLSVNRYLNDFFGRFVGFFGLMSLPLYRAAHYFHHSYLSTERDEELWPFVIPGTSIWFRRAAAASELIFGLFHTPAMFLRTFLRQKSPIRNPRVRFYIWLDLAFLSVGWLAILIAVTWTGVWYWFVFMYLVPALIAGLMQSLRKYVEHMGLTSASALGSTRSVVSPGIMGRLLSFSLFNEPYHGVHHQDVRIPCLVYPRFTDLVMPLEPEDTVPFPNYRMALLDMFKSLGDPRVGRQWHRQVDQNVGSKYRAEARSFSENESANR
jgi:fatty acid desaturase